MEVGMQMIFTSHGYDDVSDGQVYDEEIQLAMLAEELGFGSLWPVEHHYYDYSFCPDNTQMLAYLAGRTERIELATGAIILPWNEPLRVAEKVSMLDHLSNGRVRLGVGRGLSRREYSHFRGIEMDEARGRFDESSLMVQEALETGFMEGDGEYYPQPRTEIRPRPTKSFKGRTYAIAGSRDSVEACAQLGAHLVMFAENRWEKRIDHIEGWRSRHRELHGTEAPAPMTADFTFVHPDADYAKEMAERHMAVYLMSILEHYELFSDHFAEINGYRGYAKQAQFLEKIGVDGYIKGFLAANAWGTPEQLIETFRARRDTIGDFELVTCFRYGGMPFDEAEASMRLFAAEVLPELQSW
jgi:alkanesulfonate monooxygenase SsuD/methylene tetrahydromethanopterin reductase-like flavin-dependent oxidoreductase (luciferase family)